MNIVPYVTIGWCILLLLFEIFLQYNYKNRSSIKRYFCYLDNRHINIYNFYKLFTSLITHTNFVRHFIPNFIVTAVIGTLLERLIGHIKMAIYSVVCMFIFWPVVFILKIKSQTGCGFSAIFYSFFSIYFCVKAIEEKDKSKQIVYICSPFIILVVFHVLGRIRSTSTEFIHVLSLLYGYIIGIYEYTKYVKTTELYRDGNMISNNKRYRVSIRDFKE